MIKVESITIKEFRGIRNLTLNLKRKNFAVCGQNGTGKSGIVDAIEFALTGNISRLSGKGTGSITVREHAPHVDSRNRPDNAEVTLQIFIPSLNKTVKIQRNVSKPTTPIITPDEPAVQEIINKVSLHPEFVLTRREIIKYVLSTPGDRAKEIQALLRLDQVEALRTALLKISNTCKRDVTQLGQSKTHSKNQLLRSLQITELTNKKFLDSVNSRRSLLRLPVITVLTATTAIKDGLGVSEGKKSLPQIPKIQAAQDILNSRKTSSRFTEQDIINLCRETTEALTKLNEDPETSKALTRQDFLTLALELVDENNCPVCDTEWEIEELKEIINKKLQHFKSISEKRTIIERQINPIKELLGQLKVEISNLAKYAILLNLPDINRVLQEYQSILSSNHQRLSTIIPLPETIEILENFTKIPPEILESIGKIETAISLIPEPTVQDAARDYLVINQERLKEYRASALSLQRGKEHAEMAQTIYDCYIETSTKVLNEIYKEVEKDFRDFYRTINSDDEGSFEAQLVPSMGKLGFDVDFYGRGFFPPGAYHSEGHQDSMGICLYLALMKHLLGDSFTFAVLDDVLMSVDSGHRREICNLLKTNFPNTQFILTTHDGVWLRHMQTTGIVSGKDCIQFRKWDVDHGPTEWADLDVWKEIEDYIDKNDIRAAAGLLRHFLEYNSAEICHRLRAKVEFRGDAQFQLGDLLPQACSQFKKLLQLAEDSARSWGNTEVTDALATKKSEFAILVAQSNVEQWQINPAVHYNEWITLTKQDFGPVATVFKQLLVALSCPNCLDSYYASPDRGPMQALRCTCGNLNANLLKKKVN